MVQNPEIAIFMEYVRFLNSHKLALSGLVKGPKPLINSLHAPSSGRFNLRDLSARRGVVLYAYRTHTDSALTSIPSGAISFCQEHSGLPVTRFCLLKSTLRIVYRYLNLLRIVKTSKPLKSRVGVKKNVLFCKLVKKSPLLSGLQKRGRDVLQENGVPEYLAYDVYLICLMVKIIFICVFIPVK